MLAIKGLVAGYGGATVLHGVDITISAGELVAVIGPNGAGKSTLLRAISGLVGPTQGSIQFDGHDLLEWEPDQVVRHGLIHVPEGRMVLHRMTVHENIMLGAYARPRNADLSGDLAYVLDLFPSLAKRLSQVAGTLSGGEQQMLAIARGLMASPRLLMLDEPSLGIAPLLVEKIFSAIEQIRTKGVTILLVEQNAVRALSAAARAYVLDLGRVTAEGAAASLLVDERVRQAYLGI